MSWSVAGSNASNPLGFLQSLWPQSASANGTQGQSDPLSSLLAALDQQNPGTQNPSSNASSPTSPSSTSAATGTGAQFGPQTLQALLALQTDNSDPQTLAAQVSGALQDSDSASAQQPGATQGHHGHHHMRAGGSGGQNFLSLLAGTNGSATTQTTANPNGTTTTSITYADGSTVSTTTAAAAGGTAGSDVTSASAGGANVTSGNLLERLIQMQAQLLAPAASQSVTA